MVFLYYREVLFHLEGSAYLISVVIFLSVSVFKNATRAALSWEVKFSKRGLPFGNLSCAERLGWFFTPVL